MQGRGGIKSKKENNHERFNTSFNSASGNASCNLGLLVRQRSKCARGRLRQRADHRWAYRTER